MSEVLSFTPQLREWALHNIDRGIPPAPLARAMVEHGVDPQLAATLVNTFWAARASGAPLPGQALGAEQIEAARYRRPSLRLAQGNRITVDGRAIGVALRLEQPAIAVLDKLLDDDECEQLIALAAPRMRPSTVVDPATGQDQVSAARSSEGMFFRLEENPLVARIDRRVSQLMNLPLENGEGLQVLRYPVGAQSTPHYDFLMPTNEANAASVARSGQRVSTLIMYLNEVAQGGETVFPETGLAVSPRKGSALYFEYCNPDGQVDPLSLHAGAPVIAGEKWIVTKWMRQRKFVSAPA